jgi:1-deoxy-D-xylulose-5-phosphate synthase
MVLPDTFIAQDKPERMYELAGLSADGIVATVLGALGTKHQPVQRVGVGFRLH